MAYEDNVFLNCPFDDDYQTMFDGIVFVIYDCGFIVRSSYELSDASLNRLNEIERLIEESRYGVHDISRVELDKESGLPRFNMPMELGLFLGSKRFGRGQQKNKTCLILDKERYRYQKFLSDIAGQDVRAHDGDEQKAMSEVRNWLRTSSGRNDLPGPALIWKRFVDFEKDLPAICSELRIKRSEMMFADYVYALGEWLTVNPR